MLKIGLTGGIGSGKTTVAKIFEVLNVPVYYADAASKRLYHTDVELMANIKKHFGEAVYTAGQLNRAVLAQAVFNDAEKLTLLNSLVHPPTIKDAEIWMQQQTAPYVIKEAALLFESGSASGLHFIIGVHAPLELRIRRVMERDSAAREAVLARMKRQMDDDAKMKLCNFIISNNEEGLVVPQVLKLHKQFLEMSSSQSTQPA